MKLLPGCCISEQKVVGKYVVAPRWELTLRPLACFTGKLEDRVNWLIQLLELGDIMTVVHRFCFLHIELL